MKPLRNLLAAIAVLGACGAAPAAAQDATATEPADWMRLIGLLIIVQIARRRRDWITPGRPRPIVPDARHLVFPALVRSEHAASVESTQLPT